MCGICGIVRFDKQPIDVTVFDKMRVSMAHRGPDDYGQYINDPVGIANLRLSIIDLKTGQQPIFNEDRRISIVFNGEIYNYQELRARLTDHQFMTQSDTESILHAYEEWGMGSLAELNGMFALAIWDEHRQELLLARDRIGIKPLYYTVSPHYFAFASEIKALLSANLVRADVNINELGTYLAMKYVPSEQTLFKNVQRLLPGQWLRIRANGDIKSGFFWEFKLEPDQDAHTTEDYSNELHYLIQEAVRDQLVADVPVGVFLSGGLDSGIVLTEMARQKGTGIRAFTIDYDLANPQQNEASRARPTASLTGALHDTVTCSSNEARDLTELLVYYLDEPISEPLLAPSFLLARAARREVTVALGGEGADELFAGYSRYKLSYWMNMLQYVPKVIRKASLNLADDWLGTQNLLTRVLRTSIDRGGLNDWYSVFTRQESRALLGHPSEVTDHINGKSLLDSMLEFDTRCRLPEYILTRSDKMTMASSLEMRPPLLDNRIVEFARHLPANLKLRGREEKYILRLAYDKILPSEVTHRPKLAFSAPYEAWITVLRNKYLYDSHMAQAGLLVTDELKRLLKGDNCYRGRYSEKLWTLIILEIWYRIFIDQTITVQPISHPAPLY